MVSIDTRARKKPRKDSDSHKKTQEVSKQTKDQGATAGDVDSASSLLTTFVWIPVLFAVGIYLYLNPSIFINFIDDWIGFSEHYDAAPAARQPVLTYLPADATKRDAVVLAFKHSWHAYEKNAMGDDEYHPLSKNGSNLTEAGGIGYMVVDVLDSLQIMDLWVEDELSFDRDAKFSTFETTIRVLGGLLSAYHLSDNDPLYLDKAIDLADRMLPAFDTPGYQATDFPYLVSIAEVATLQLEFRYLSYLTGNEAYWRAVENVMKVVKRARLPHGLASIFMGVEDGQYETSSIRLGSRGDSFYEYLLKQYLQTNNSEPVYREMYEDAMDAVHKYLIQQSMGNKMIYIMASHTKDHLVCFFGGSSCSAQHAQAHWYIQSPSPRPEELSEKGLRDWKTGMELIKTCMNTHDTQTGLSPEVVYFRVPSDGMDGYAGAPSDWYIKGAAVGEFPPYDARYMLRPRLLTGDQRYRDHGWSIFHAIDTHCRVADGGYATIINVDENPARQEDRMETFFLSETLKYLYLLFSSSDVIPLDKYILNTEAHPFPIFEPSMQTGFS
ncbi:mannosyl-oligosaccharide 1,2-alpha-mannosidase [Gymnopilus junonius]|uniref:alpha-1,2-Mannosidase n=1 Tax=Gymnopilus junonius TaxID=109634 RepID=A0A9P5NXS9_GYMJU|nr:mannosyl-oligosaccharide 1,2-alpha-mannosidase [Gymnopilus junonius]